MTLIQLFVFTSIALALQHLLYKMQLVSGPSWYRKIRYSRGWDSFDWYGFKYLSVLFILWIALVLSEEITYIIGLKLYG